MKYTISDLRQDFPDDEACLEWLVNWRWPDGITCKNCQEVTKHYKVKSRRSYSCSKCGHHVHPTAGTIFHKSSTPLVYWFYAMFVMTNTRCGISAAQLCRELGVTYKTAWRMLHKVREMMAAEGIKLEGEVEIDETFIHGNVYKRSTAKKRYGRTGMRQGQIVFGMVERGGRAKLFHVPSTGVRVLMPKIEANIRFGSTIYSDGFRGYKTLTKRGYNHYRTFHEQFQWTDGSNHVQNIESLWSRFKMGIKAVYRHVSGKHLQKYADEFGYRHSHRHAISMFWALLGQVSRQPA